MERTSGWLINVLEQRRVQEAMLSVEGLSCSLEQTGSTSPTRWAKGSCQPVAGREAQHRNRNVHVDVLQWEAGRLFFLLVLGIKPRALCIRGKNSHTELHSHPWTCLKLISVVNFYDFPIITDDRSSIWHTKKCFNPGKICLDVVGQLDDCFMNSILQLKSVFLCSRRAS